MRAALILLAVVSVGALRVPTAWDEKKVNFKKHMPKKYNAKEKKWSKYSENHLGNGIWHQFLDGKENINFGPGNIGLQGPADPIIIPKENWKSTNWKPTDSKFDNLGLTTNWKPTDSLASTTSWNNFDVKTTKPVWNKSLEDTLKTLQQTKNKKYGINQKENNLKKETTKIVQKLEEASPNAAKTQKASETRIPQEAKNVEEDIPDLSQKEDEVPTRPIYPGEGVWAKPGFKHHPYIRPEHIPIQEEEEDKEEDVLAEAKKETPGDLFFEKASDDYTKQSDNFNEDLKTLQSEDFKTKPLQTESDVNEEDEEDDFVPLKTYAQVRKYENSEHLPASVLEPRLKQVVRDSVIHTVYTEEGYEDLGYDHAGHEKNAENNEGYEEYDESKKEPQVEASGYEEPNFAQTAVTKTTQVKQNGTDGMEYEVSSKMNITLANSKAKLKVTYSTSKPEIDTRTAEFIMADISKHFSRKKRFVNDFPKIEVDTSFIDKIRPPQIKISPTTEKYPYYKMQNLNKNSPLRYAQDMSTIPIKTEDKMAVYDRNDGIECEEVQEPDVIPKHIENAEQNEEIKEEDREEPKTPRLKGLGDKIDCFKLKYFGEEPLDSPIFKEEEIGAPEPIFEELKPKPKSNSAQINYDKTKSDQNLDASQEVQKINTEKISPPAMPKIVYYSKRTLSPRQARSSPLQASERFSRSANSESSTIEKSPTISSGQSDNSTEILGNNTKPEHQALRIIIKAPRRKYPQIYATIRKDKFPPRYPLGPPPGYTYNYKTSTVPPKQNTLSEVFYKDEIKPSEQMNVFADIINNIKNSSLLIEEEERFKPSAYDVVNSFYSTSTLKAPVEQSVVEESMDHVLIAPTPSSFDEPFPYRKKKYPMYKVHEQIYDDFPRKKISNAKPPIPHFLKPQVPNNAKPPIFDNISKSTFFDNISQPPVFDNISKPTTFMKKNIPIEEVSYQINPVTSYTTLEVPLNKYYVPGMKPPPSVEKPFVYADYKMKNPNLLSRRYALLRRHKRSPARYSYSEIRRPTTKKPEEEEEEVEEEDDYVPHRPTNYHYDPSSDKIIYKTTTGGPQELEEIEIDEEEDDKDEETVVVKTTTTRTVYHKDVLNKANGLTLVDFLEKLRANPSYVAIPDPEPTEKTTTTTSTISPDKTTPPAFLGFLAQLHSAEGYVKIEDEDEKAKSKPTTTTTEAPEEEEEEEDEVVQGNVQNSPGGQFNNRQDFQLFDISEYLPKTKNYSPRTSIDYSKYKTIERTTARHNLSSKYNEEEDSLPLKGEEGEENNSKDDRRKGYEEIRRKYSNEDRRKNHKEDSEEDNTENRRNIYNEDRRKNHKDESEENNNDRRHVHNGDRRITHEASEIDEDLVVENLAEANSFPSTSTTTTTTTTTIKPTTKQRRRRPTTTKAPAKPTRSTTFRPSTSTTARVIAIRTRPSTTISYKESEDKYTPATHRAPTRVYPRRPRPSPKIRLRTTTEDSIKEEDDKEGAESQNRRVRKLNENVNKVPANHKAFYRPIVVEDQEGIVETQKQPRLITPDILSYNATRKGENIDRKLDVEVFKDYDEKHKHGGNYVYENPSFEEEMKQVVKYIDNVPKFYGREKSKEITEGNTKGAPTEIKETTFSSTNYKEAKPNVRFANRIQARSESSEETTPNGRFQITTTDEDEDTNKDHIDATTRRPNNVEARRLAAMRFKANRKLGNVENTDKAKAPDYAKARRIAASRFRSSRTKEEPKPSTENYEETKARRLLPIIEARRIAASRFKANTTPSIEELRSNKDEAEERRNLEEDNNETRLEDKEDVVDEDEVKINFGTTTKTPLIIKDPSKRLYFYAPL